MKPIFTSYLVSIALIASAAATSASNDASDVTAGLFCLSHSRFKFEDPGARTHHVRYLIDTDSFEGERHILLFVEAAGGRTHWYDIEVVKSGPVRGYRLVNNAVFAVGHRDFRLVDPPLGGISANERLEHALAETRQQPTLVVKAAGKPADKRQCGSFDDGFANKGTLSGG